MRVRPSVGAEWLVSDANNSTTICVEPRQSGTSHAVFKTPWPGDPRVNIQRSRGGEAKPYQVRQVLKAIDKLKEEQT